MKNLILIAIMALVIGCSNPTSGTDDEPQMSSIIESSSDDISSSSELLEETTIKGVVNSNGTPTKARVSLLTNSKVKTSLRRSFKLANVSEGEIVDSLAVDTIIVDTIIVDTLANDSLLTDSLLLDTLATTETDSTGEYEFDRITLLDGDTLSIHATCLSGSTTGKTTIQATGESIISVKSIECNSSGIVNIQFKDSSGFVIINDKFRINDKEINVDENGIYSSIVGKDGYEVGDTLLVYPNDTNTYVNDTIVLVLDDASCTYTSCDFEVTFDKPNMNVTLSNEITLFKLIKSDGTNSNESPIYTTDSTDTYKVSINKSMEDYTIYIHSGEIWVYTIQIKPNESIVLIEYKSYNENGSTNPSIYIEHSITSWYMDMILTPTSVTINGDLIGSPIQ